MKISYGKQFLEKDDYLNVLNALKSEFITQGNNIEKLEKLIKKKFNSKNAILTSSGTAAMHLLGIALGWRKNDIILITSITFVSTANIIDHLGCKLDLVDIDINTFNICASHLERKLKYYKNKKKNVKAIIATDYAGLPCDWKKLKKISKKYNTTLINDNCHAIGSKYEGKIDYSTKYADFAIHSYHAVKNITTGEGGCVLTKNDKVANTIKLLRSHGIVDRNKNKISWYYDVKKPGYNYRITDFQSALGISQLQKIDKFIKRRTELAKYYFKKIKSCKFIKFPQSKLINGHTYHLLVALIDFKKLKIKKSFLFNYLKKKNIFLQVHYIPVFKFSYFKKKYKFNKNDYPNSNIFYDQCISLPLFYQLSKKNIDYVLSSILKIIKK